MCGIHIINESFQNYIASNMYGQILFQHLFWLYRLLLFHLPPSCLSMVAQMQFFCLSLADTTYPEVMIFSLPFPFLYYSLPFSSVSVFPLADIVPSVAVFTSSLQVEWG